MTLKDALAGLRHDEPALNPLRRDGDLTMLLVNASLFAVSLAIGLGTDTAGLATAIGGPSLALAGALRRRRPGELITRCVMGAAFMIFTGLMIQQLGGLVEAHFAAFGLIGFLLYYRDWRPIAAATVVIYLHHLSFTWLQGNVAGFYIFASGAAWSTFFLHVAYFLPYVSIMGYIALRLEQQEVANQRVITLANRIARGDIDRFALPRENTDPLLLAVAEIWDQFWRLIRDLPSSCLVIRRRDGVVIAANRVLLDLLGRTEDAMVGRPVASLGLGIERWPVALASGDGLRHGEYPLPTGAGTGEGVASTVAGAASTVEVSAAAYFRGDDELLVLILRDVTQERASKRHLREAKEAAERALAELNRTQAELIQAEKMAALGSLVAGIAHEINTPVGITLTAASALNDETRQIREQVQAGQARKSQVTAYLDLAGETTALMVTHCHQAANLINSFKQAAVDQTSDERRPIDLGRYLGEVALSLSPQLRKSAITVTIDCPDGMVVDTYPGAISQVVTNLAMNSLVHGFEDRSGGDIRIAARRDESGRVELRFSDTGRCIPAGIVGRIFEPFFTTRRGRGGSGLGLNIVHNLVTQRLRGVIDYEDTPGGGATFVLRFPAAGG